MKRLYILRHAHTTPSGDGGDRERKLTPQGLQDARVLGETMKAKGYVPDFILCSPVTRTRQTHEQICEGIGKIQTEFPKSIYEGGYGELLSLTQGTDDQFSSLMVVGHNPSIHQFAASLALDDGHPAFNMLALGYAPATLTVLDIPHASWKDLQPGENKIVEMIEPNE
jgi:phosphohistidine phosphatase